MELGFEHDEFGIIVPLDIGERANLTGYNNPAALNALDLVNGHTPTDTRWPTVNLADPAYAIPPDPPAIAGLLYEGKRHVCSGPQESAKTLIAYHLLLLALRQGSPVALLDFEMGPVATRRMLTDCGATPRELSDIWYSEPLGAPTTTDIEAVVGRGTRYVLVDAAAGAFDLTGLDDNSRKDAEAWARQWVQPLFQLGIATIVLDHVTKNVEGRGKYAIGSERKTGGADVHLGFDALKTLTRGGSGLVKVTAHKDRGAYLNRPTALMVELDSDPETHAITITYKAPDTMEDGPVKHTIYAERVSKALEANDGQPMSQRQLVEACQGGTDYIRDAANELVQAGYATVEIGLRDARNYTLIKPFRREEYDRATTAPEPRLSAVNHDRATAPLLLQEEARVSADSDAPQEQSTAPDPVDVYDPSIQHLMDELEY